MDPKIDKFEQNRIFKQSINLAPCFIKVSSNYDKKLRRHLNTPINHNNLS